MGMGVKVSRSSWAVCSYYVSNSYYSTWLRGEDIAGTLLYLTNTMKVGMDQSTHSCFVQGE